MRQLTYKYSITVGALLRRPVRRRLLEAGFSFREEKGFLDSAFFINGLTLAQLKALQAWVARINAAD